MTDDRPAAPLRVPAIAVASASLLAALAWSYVFAESIPFYFEDVELVLLAVERNVVELLRALVDPTALDTRYGLFDRPAELLVLKALHAAAGFEPAVFHAFKGLCMLAVAGLAFAWIWRATGALVFPALAALWLTVSHPIYQSTLWIVDFDVVAHVFILVALMLWARQLAGVTATSRAVVLETIAIVTLAYVGSKTKGSALVLPATIVLSGAAFGVKRFARAVLIALAIGLLALAPRLADPAAVGAAIRWANVGGFAAQLPHAIAFGLPGLAVAAASLLGLAFVVWPAPQRNRRARAAAAIALAWNGSASALWPLLPSSETRYLVGFLVPAIFGVCLAGACVTRAARPRGVRHALAGALFVVVTATIAHDTALAIHFRGVWGSRFIAADRTMATVEESFERALVLYRYRRWVFYSPGSERGNRYVLARERALSDVLGKPSDGSLRVPPRFEELLWVDFDDAPLGAEPVARIEGRADTLFDRWLPHLGLRPQEIDLMTLEMRSGAAYPVTLGLYRRDLTRGRTLPAPSRPCVEGEGKATERYFGTCLHAEDVFGTPSSR